MLLGEVLTDSEIGRMVTSGVETVLLRIEVDLCRGFTEAEWDRALVSLGAPLETAIRALPRPEAS